MAKVRSLTLLAALFLSAAAASAGNGWYVQFFNFTPSTITVAPAGDTCWYRNDLGSTFTIAPFEVVRKYTEEKNSVPCGTQKSIVGVDINGNGRSVHVELKGMIGDFGPTIVSQSPCPDKWNLFPDIGFETWNTGHMGSSDNTGYVKAYCAGSGRTNPLAIYDRVLGGGSGSGIYANVFIQTPLQETVGASNLYVRLANRTSGRCLDLKDGNRANGAAIQQWDCNVNTSNMRWLFYYAGDGYFYLVDQTSKACLDLKDGNRANGATIQQWDCSYATNNMQWKVQDLGGGWFNLVNRTSGSCLDLSDGNLANGASVQQWACDSNPNMQWKFQ